MKRLVIIFILLPLKIISQEVLDDLNQVMRFMNAQDEFAMRIEYSVYAGHSSNNILDKGAYTYAYMDKKSFVKTPDGTEYFTNDTIYVVVDHRSQNIFIDHHIENFLNIQKEESRVYEIASLITGDFISTKTTTEDGRKKHLVQYKSGALDSMMFIVNAENSFIDYQVLYYKYLSQDAQHKPSLISTFTKLDVNDFKDSLSLDYYFLYKGGSYQVSDKYGSYKLLYSPTE